MKRKRHCSPQMRCYYGVLPLIFLCVESSEGFVQVGMASRTAVVPCRRFGPTALYWLPGRRSNSRDNSSCLLLQSSSHQPINAPPLPPNNNQHDNLPYTESPARSAVKTLVYKLASAGLTVSTVRYVTGQWQSAVRMLALSAVHKLVALFVLDRWVNQRGVVRVRRHAGHDTTAQYYKWQQALWKVAVWRGAALVANVILALWVLRDGRTATQWVSLELALKCLLTLVYERAWAQIGWGKTILHINRNNGVGE